MTKPLAPLVVFLLASFSIGNAWSMDLDWSGQFRAEAHWLNDYQMGNTALKDPVRNGAGGYYIPGGGTNEAQFQTLFLKLRPKLIVNDNVAIKSEWWVGDPIYGYFGSAAPYPGDQKQYYSNQSRGSTITAQRFWAEFVSEVGTFQVGRAPLHYGLGLVWNNGDGLWDRYESTGDTFRLVSKFGAFSVVPAFTKYTMGNNLGGACTYTGGSCNPQNGGAGLSDYSVTFKYDNQDEDFEGGVNFIKRIAGAAQDVNGGYSGVISGTPAGMNYNTWDLFAKKRFGKFTIAGELPITNGNIGGVDYKTFALAMETDYKANDSWDFALKAGHAPGQPNDLGGGSSKYRAFYFNPNYKIALIMFNYQLMNFAGPNTQNNPNVPTASQASPFDNPIVNANYLAFNPSYTTEKWSFRTNFAWAQARETAKPGETFYNTWTHKTVLNPSANNKTQQQNLGWEMDYGTTFKWDDAFQFHLDVGWFFPGDFYKFSNTTVDNQTSAVFATVFKVGVVF